ncbi:MAG: cytochrome ubiquinol oxidase subunit I [Actinomycetota bacterium]|nr:cytochrome ubiquinol oxidase subunit I [Actinomycetota bacterium]
MDAVLLSRLQFAVTVGFHFLFVPLTIGFALLVAVMETLYVRSGDTRYKSMAKFWGKLFTINFVLGVVTGLTMEFQFGTNWSEYSKFMGDIFGSPLAIEALMAFFLESTFISIWIFGWERVSKKVHLFAAWMVALGTHLSAIWIIVANGWMQNPVGYVLRNGRAELVDFVAVVTNSYAWHMYFHVILSAYVLSGFVVLGICAYHLLRGRHVEFFQKSFRFGLVIALIGVLGVALTGHFNGQKVARVQPSKFAAMEAIWETGREIPAYLVVVPNEESESNPVEAVGIPGLTSFLAFNNSSAEVKGLKDIPLAKRPPVALTFWSFRIMVLLGIYFLAVAAFGWYLQAKNRLLDSTRFLKLLLYSIPLPYIATNLGWTVTEVGRQPWTVYGLMTTAKSVSPAPASNVLFSLAAVIVLYSALVGLDFYLIAKNAKKGPEPISEAEDDSTVVRPEFVLSSNS